MACQQTEGIQGARRRSLSLPSGRTLAQGQLAWTLDTGSKRACIQLGVCSDRRSCAGVRCIELRDARLAKAPRLVTRSRAAATQRAKWGAASWADRQVEGRQPGALSVASAHEAAQGSYGERGPCAAGGPGGTTRAPVLENSPRLPAVRQRPGQPGQCCFGGCLVSTRAQAGAPSPRWHLVARYRNTWANLRSQPSAVPNPICTCTSLAWLDSHSSARAACSGSCSSALACALGVPLQSRGRSKGGASSRDGNTAAGGARGGAARGQRRPAHTAAGGRQQGHA